MNLAHAYARLIQEADDAGAKPEFAGKIVTYMKSKGHLSLLPRVLRIAERMPKTNEAVVTVKNDADYKRYEKDIKTALSGIGHKGALRVAHDAKIVGGYSVRAGGKITDRSFRSALVSIYQNTVRS